MKKTLFTMTVVLLAVAAQAQLKIHDDGHISLGSLTKNYGVQVQPNGYTYFCTQSDSEWGWGTLSYAKNDKQKHWIVSNLVDESHPGRHTFFVTGNGCVYKSGSWKVADSSNQLEDDPITGAGAVLDSITGFWYIPVEEGGRAKASERRVGVSAQEVERVLPEAVTADEDGLLYVDYEALTVFLIEAAKEQRQEIIELRKALEENGLIEPKKP